MRSHKPASAFALMCLLAVAFSQTACLFNTDPVDIKLVNTDTIGVAKGEIGYIANGEIYLLNAAGGGARQVTSGSGNKTRLSLRPDRRQVIYTTAAAQGFPSVENLEPPYNNTPNLSTIDYAAPRSFGYKSDTLYFLTATATRFKSTSLGYTNYIIGRLNVLASASDTLLYLSISPKNDIALVIKTGATNPYKLVLQAANGTIKTYNSPTPLGQPEWSQSANWLVLPTADGVFGWAANDILPKMVIFEQNIQAFAVNPIGTEIAYSKGDGTIFIKNLNFTKSNRTLRTLPEGAPVRDIDWK